MPFIWPKKAYTTLFIHKPAYVFIRRPHWSLERSLFYLRNHTLERLKKRLSPRTYQLFNSIFLGNKHTQKRLTEKNKEHFNTWGVSHYLARSGLHMIIFIVIWQFLFMMIPCNWIVKELFLILLSCIYLCLSWTSISFNRAFLTFIFYKFLLLFRIQTQFFHLLTVICFLILFYNPLHIFFLDFQLSFGLTFALACFNQIKTHHKYTHYQIVAS